MVPRILLLVVLFSGVVVQSSLGAKEKLIVCVKSSGLPQYSETLAGFKEVVLKENPQVRLREYELNSESEKIIVPGEKPDLIFAIGSKALDFLRNKFSDRPIVFSMVLNPDFSETNITGVSLNIPPLLEFKLLKKILPRAKKIGVIYDPNKSKAVVENGRAQAKTIGLELVAATVDSIEGVYEAVRTIGKTADVLWMVPDSTVYTAKSTEDILLYTLREKIPLIGISPNYVRAGALFSLSYDYADIGRHSAGSALRILNGELPADIPVALPTKIDISLNIITAERIGIQIPYEIIKAAKDIYQ